MMRAQLSVFLLAVFSLLSVQSGYAQVIFSERFENGVGPFEGLTIDTVNPGEGKACACLKSDDPSTNPIVLVKGTGLIPVKPDSWYRFSFLFRNTIGNGEIKYGFQESSSATEMRASWYSWQWHALPLNIDSWNRYTGEFRTAKGTKAIKLHFRTENNLSGLSWLDDFSIEAFTPVIPPLEIKPYDAAASYTDIPTMQASFRKTAEGREYLWNELDLGNMPLGVTYRELPAGTIVCAEVIRGSSIVFMEGRTVQGSGETTFDIGVGKLPEGIYRFRVSSFTDGKVTCVREKELWRISYASVRAPRLETIQSVGIGENRQILVNGKGFRRVAFSHFPTPGLLLHHQKFCRPDLKTYLKNAQEQFGINTCVVWNWRANRWDGKLDEYAAQAVSDLNVWLDFLHQNNFYGLASFDELTERGRRLPRQEWLRALAAGIQKHPALFGYTLDEPEIPKYSSEKMKECHDFLKSLDPAHLVHVNLCDHSRFREFAPCTDLASLDVYPFPGMSLLETEKRMRRLVEAFPPNTPIFEYLQVFNFNDLPMPTFDQIRGTFVLDRIFGSRSLNTYSWVEAKSQSFLTDMELQAYCRAIYAMFMKIEDAMDNGKCMEWPVVSSIPEVRTVAIRNEGQTIVLAVNISKDKQAEVSFQTEAKSAADFMDGAWAYPIENRTLKLSLPPSGTAILRLKD